MVLFLFCVFMGRDRVSYIIIYFMRYVGFEIIGYFKYCNILVEFWGWVKILMKNI